MKAFIALFALVAAVNCQWGQSYGAGPAGAPGYQGYGGPANYGSGAGNYNSQPGILGQAGRLGQGGLGWGAPAPSAQAGLNSGWGQAAPVAPAGLAVAPGYYTQQRGLGQQGQIAGQPGLLGNPNLNGAGFGNNAANIGAGTAASIPQGYQGAPVRTGYLGSQGPSPGNGAYDGENEALAAAGYLG